MMQCKSCDKKLRKNNLSGLCSMHYRVWWEKNKRNISKKKESMLAWHLKNKKEQNLKCRAYRLQNLDSIRAYDRKRAQSPSRKQACKEYEARRLKTDENFRLSKYLRNTVFVAIKANGEHPKAVEMLGCSLKKYKEYLESKFKDGMSWENYGKWHIDHITPLFKFNLKVKEEFLAASHYSNTQPLWANENKDKRNFEVWGIK